ncbi:hypothetical protein [Helicobacter sp.]|nr:hypothetical protein [Helicobacter sp.]MDY5557115.1 hypothetical protein [Helicobacter sp.]
MLVKFVFVESVISYVFVGVVLESLFVFVREWRLLRFGRFV